MSRIINRLKGNGIAVAESENHAMHESTAAEFRATAKRRYRTTANRHAETGVAPDQDALGKVLFDLYISRTGDDDYAPLLADYEQDVRDLADRYNAITVQLPEADRLAAELVKLQARKPELLAAYAEAQRRAAQIIAEAGAPMDQLNADIETTIKAQSTISGQASGVLSRTSSKNHFRMSANVQTKINWHAEQIRLLRSKLADERELNEQIDKLDSLVTKLLGMAGNPKAAEKQAELAKLRKQLAANEAIRQQITEHEAAMPELETEKTRIQHLPATDWTFVDLFPEDKLAEPKHNFNEASGAEREWH